MILFHKWTIVSISSQLLLPFSSSVPSNKKIFTLEFIPERNADKVYCESNDEKSMIEYSLWWYHMMTILWAEWIILQLATIFRWNTNLKKKKSQKKHKSSKSAYINCLDIWQQNIYWFIYLFRKTGKCVLLFCEYFRLSAFLAC